MRLGCFLLLLVSPLLLLRPTSAKCVARTAVNPMIKNSNDQELLDHDHVPSPPSDKNNGGLFASQLPVASVDGTQSAAGLVGAAIDGALKSVCAKTRDPGFCGKAADEHLSESGGNLDPKEVLLAGMQAAAQAAAVARDAASKFLQQTHTSKIENSIYETCQENYQAALDDITEIKNALAAKDFAAAKSHVDSFGANFGTCADNYADESGPSPFAKFDEELSKVWENMLDIYELIDPYPSNL